MNVRVVSIKGKAGPLGTLFYEIAIDQTTGWFWKKTRRRIFIGSESMWLEQDGKDTVVLNPVLTLLLYQTSVRYESRQTGRQ